METNAMKLQALSFSADVNAGGDLEQAECFNPALWFYMVCHCVVELLWFLNASILQ